MESQIFFYIVLSVFVLGSIIFLLLPHAGSILYVTREYGTVCGCTTKAEWVWIFITTTMLLLPNLWRLFAKISTTREILFRDKNGALIIFLVVNLVWFVLPIYRSLQGRTIEDEIQLLSLAGAKAAWPALFNLGLIMFPVKRTSEVLAISHKEMKHFHVWGGYAIGFWISLHTVLLSFVYAVREDSFDEWKSAMVPYKNLYTEGVVNFVGWIALVSYAVLWITSLPWFQNLHFEQFKWLHVLFSVSFIFFSNLHDYNTLHFIQPGIAVFFADHLIRRYSNLTTRIDQNVGQRNHDESSGNDMKIVFSTSSHHIDAQIVGITFEIPGTWTLPLRPGMFVYLKDTLIAPLQYHPFSICNIDSEKKTCTIFIKAMGDWTTKFIEKVQTFSARSSELMSLSTAEAFVDHPNQRMLQQQKFGLEIEGPYGCEFMTGDYNGGYFFIAGGVGLTGISETIIKRHRNQSSQTLVWMVRTIEEMAFFVHQILSRLDPTHTTTKVKIFVTAPPPQELPSPLTSPENQVISTINATFKTVSSLPFGNAKTKIASIVGVSFSFLVARLLCCYRSVPNISDDDNALLVHECSFAFQSSRTCVHCSPEDDQTQQLLSLLPCCTVEVCFFSFRALPMLFTFFITPALAFLLVPSVSRLQWWLRHIKMKHMCLYEHPNENPSETGDNEHFTYYHTNRSDHYYYNEQQRTCHNHESRSISSSSSTSSSSSSVLASLEEQSNYPISVEIRKPTISELFEEFCIDSGRVEEQRRAAITVCGGPSLVHSVEMEVKRCNAQGRNFTLFQP